MSLLQKEVECCYLLHVSLCPMLRRLFLAKCGVWLRASTLPPKKNKNKKRKLIGTILAQIYVPILTHIR